MRSTLRTVTTAGFALAASIGVCATVVALPVPPARDEAQLERASALDRGYGINSFDLDAGCHFAKVVIVDGGGRSHDASLRQCD